MNIVLSDEDGGLKGGGGLLLELKGGGDKGLENKIPKSWILKSLD